jgi:TonB dependent receptor
MPRRHALAAVTVIAWLMPAVHAQTPQPAVERQPLGNSLTSDALADLPSGATIFSLLDTAIPEVISDRVDAGSLTPGQPARLGAHGSSWTQTMFRIGEVDVSDPDASGTPLILPGVLAWQRMEVATGAMALGMNAPGLAVTLVPRRPAAAWTRSIALFGARPGLLSRTATTDPPAISRLNTWTSGSVLASGPLIPDRLGIVLEASWTKATRFERDDSTRLNEKLGSLFSHLVFTPTPQDEMRFIGWVQRTGSPFEHRIAFGQPDAAEHATSVHLQAEWERRKAADTVWTGFASFSARRRTTDLQPVPAIVTERLSEGPVPDLVAPFGTDKAWSLGGKLAPFALARFAWSRRHTLQGGLTLSGGSAGGRTPFGVRIGELVDGVPARVWDYSRSTIGSHWSQFTLSAYAGDTILIHPRAIVDGGLRFDWVSAGAATNANGISWHDLFPSVGLRWELTDFKRIAALVRFNRYGYRLPLGDLAYGDSLAPTADVYRWTATGTDPGVTQLGALVSRVGPGTGSDPDFSAIDPQLSRPYINELTLGFESRPNNQTLVRVMGIARHEGQLVGLVNTGVPPSAYTAFTLVDPGKDSYAGQTLLVYNRPPDTFGADRYLLTNPAGHHATFASVEITAQTTINRLFLIAGGTAGRSEATSANRGFLVTENDHGLVGEVLTDPNAATNARGRPFTERGYTIKTAGIYHFNHDVRFGVAARYQDGQHFARLVIVPGLNQGVEAIRASVNGKTRFTYTLTVDARLQKDFTLRGRHFTGVIDAYNLLNTRTEIEEFPVTGPLSRSISAVQPPRSLHVGFRLPF